MKTFRVANHFSTLDHVRPIADDLNVHRIVPRVVAAQARHRGRVRDIKDLHAI